VAPAATILISIRRAAIRFLAITVIIVMLAGACGTGDKPSRAGPTSTARAVAFQTPSSRGSTRDDWIEVRGKASRLSLPDSWEGGDVEEDLPVILEHLDSLGEEYAGFSEIVAANPEAYDLIAVDSHARGFATNVIVARERVLSTIDLNDYAAALAQQLPPTFSIVQQENRFLAGFQVIVVTTTTAIADLDVKQRIYVRKEGQVIWAVTYTSTSTDFDLLSPVFEESYATFEVVD
jgi:hypothetical protein